MILKEVRKNKIESRIIVFFSTIIFGIFVFIILLAMISPSIEENNHYYNNGSYYTNTSIQTDLILTALTLTVPICVITSLITYYNCDKIVLHLNGAKQVSYNEYPELTTIMDNLCIATGLPRPKLYIMQDTALNAFATGRNAKNAVIVVTSGLISKLDKYELEGVLAHELSHIKNYDILLRNCYICFCRNSRNTF